MFYEKLLVTLYMKKIKNTIKLEIIKNKCFVNDNLWGKVWSNKNLLGDYILNVLFYTNKEGNPIKIIINGVNETSNFKKQVKKEYKNILNVDLRNNFYCYSNIK